MNQTILQALAQYTTYAKHVVLGTAAQLSTEALRTALSPSRGTILILFHHTIDDMVVRFVEEHGQTWPSKIEAQH